MCLSEIYSRVRIGQFLSDTFPIHCWLKEGDAVSPLLFNFVLEQWSSTLAEMDTMDMELEDEDVDMEVGFLTLFSTIDSCSSIYVETVGDIDQAKERPCDKLIVINRAAEIIARSELKLTCQREGREVNSRLTVTSPGVNMGRACQRETANQMRNNSQISHSLIPSNVSERHAAERWEYKLETEE
ncbi:hypothetical protein ANN_02025 [Periplaneta americana]|uniref:Uncharacterized protein n=1 Tax=Periplaneta americana TaxID=6978 RepID=A0ABQ8TV85_PERAM|nr:hypothetical protein ANN_02025 [Periplaneta americana]